MKRYLLIVLLISGVCFGVQTVRPVDKDNVDVDPGQVHSARNTWVIMESELSGDTQATDLAVTERTYQLVVAAIAAAGSGDDNISIFDIPRSWNSIQFSALGITDDGTVTHQIYLGNLGSKHSSSPSTDVELVYAAQLAWTVGTQSSIYHQVAFTSGGTRAIVAGDTITGATSGETAIVTAVSDLSSGTWAGGDAAGTLTLRTKSGTFQSENLNVTTADGASSANSATIGADLIGFEMADTVLITESDHPKAWTAKSPTGNRNATAMVDVFGADIMVIVTTVSSADSKLLGTGI